MPYGAAHLLRAIKSTSRAGNHGTALCFLYETATLQKLMLQVAAARSAKCFSASSKSFRSRHTPSDPLKFAIDELSSDADADGDGLPARGTITARERETFNRIFKKITDLRASGPLVADDTTDEHATDGNDASDSEPYRSLDDIFDLAKKAIHETYNEPSHLRYRPKKRGLAEIQRAQALEAEVYTKARSYPPSLRAAYQRLAASLSNPTSSVKYKRLQLKPPEALEQGLKMEKQRTSQWLSTKPTAAASEDREFAEYEARVLHRRKADLHHVTDLFTMVKSDVDIWFILERQVFPQVEALNALIRREASKHQAAKKKPEPKSTKLPVVAPPQVPSVDLRVVHPLSILQTNFAIHCFNAMHLLRTRFPASPYAPSLITQIKSLGPIAYVLGASTSLYNELLYIRWKHYRDLHGCADLVQEMLDQGVETNDVSHAVYRDARWQRQNARLAAKDSNAQADAEAPEARWWNLRGVVDGWARWTAVDAEARRREEEEMARLQREGLETRRMQEEEEDAQDEDEETEEKLLAGNEQTDDDLHEGEEEEESTGEKEEEVVLNVDSKASETDILPAKIDKVGAEEEANVDDGDLDIEIREVAVPLRPEHMANHV